MTTETMPRSGTKAYRRGTHRACAPAETFERFRRHMKACGITRIADITGLDTIGIPVLVGVRPNSKGLSSSQGKGLDVDAARTSALMEAFESWHGENIVASGHYCRGAEAEQVYGVGTVDVSGLPRRGTRMAWYREALHFWLLGTELLTSRPILVPFDAVSSDFTGNFGRSPLIRTTNGQASGNSVMEATLHGLYEVAERDAVSAWAPTAGPGDEIIDPASVRDSYNGELLERIRRAGLGTLIRRVPSDFGIPVFAVALAPIGPAARPPFAAFSGYGAHLDPKVALARAITEAVQSRLTVIHGGRDDLWPSEYARVLDHRAVSLWIARIRDMEPNAAFSSIPDRSGESFRTDLDTVLAGFRGQVDTIAVVDLSREELAIPVVKVVVPGLLGVPFDTRPRSQARLRKRTTP
ncbi:MAG: YcaO-like family protein [Actinobacteria bacterium]|jgi:ribosomal protein S12 methylthiotransferase accessory factor|nr:YcaO-like family protein [Actinomycetota bacterium]